MRRKVFLYSALFWTGVILYFCLKNADEIRKIDIPQFDKFIHFVFHFVFTILWILYVKKKFKNATNLLIFIIVVLFSLVFGIAVEMMQQYFTINRTSDIFDVVANLSGTLTAVLLIIIVNSSNKLLSRI